MIEQQQENIDMRKSNEPSSRYKSPKCKSSKIGTHFTIPQQNQNIKMKQKKVVVKQKQGIKSIEDKQFKKLNKQYKKVKSLQQEYRQLEEQLKEIKELVKLQIQLIEHSVSEFGENKVQKHDQWSEQKKGDILFETNCSQNKQSCLKLKSMELQGLQKLITSLFSHHETLQMANSNYLLLSQVNKQQQSQALFHINNLQDRIRQLRFLLNGKEDLLAYEIATLDNTHNNSNQQSQLHVMIDYHLPKRITLANHNNTQVQFRTVQKAVTQMTNLNKTIQQLQTLLQIQKNTNNINNPNQLHSKSTTFSPLNNLYIQEHSNTFNNQTGSHTSRTPKKQIHIGKQHNTYKPFAQHQNILATPLTTRRQSQSSAKGNPKDRSLSSLQLAFLPLSITNYKNSLIYRVGKLQQLQQQKNDQLKKQYAALTEDYQNEMKTKRRLIEEYELKRDVYSYKKKLSSNPKNILNQITEDNEEDKLENNLNLENILHQLIDKQHSIKDQNNDQVAKLQEHNPRNIITTQIYLQSSPTSHSVVQINQSQNPQSQHNISSQNCKYPQNQDPIFNEITNTPKKKFSNPFLKLKNQTSTRSNFSQKQLTNSKFSNHKKEDKENLSQRKPFDGHPNNPQLQSFAEIDQINCNKLQLHDGNHSSNSTNKVIINQQNNNKTPQKNRRQPNRRKANFNQSIQKRDQQVLN